MLTGIIVLLLSLLSLDSLTNACKWEDRVVD